MSEDIINNGFLKLASAKICADCDTIYNEDFYKACPICTSMFFIRLYPVIHPLVELSESGELASCSTSDKTTTQDGDWMTKPMRYPNYVDN